MRAVSTDSDIPPRTPDTANPQDVAPGSIPLSALPRRETPAVPEIGGRQNGLDPTRYGDWEKNGRCIDF
jgi:hypothetical protein